MNTKLSEEVIKTEEKHDDVDPEALEQEENEEFGDDEDEDEDEDDDEDEDLDDAEKQLA